MRLATCSCGTLQVRCSTGPDLVSVCHCTACQKRTGSPFGIAAFFRRKAVHVDGVSTRFRRSSDTGFDVIFHFCATCGSTVFWEPTRKPDMIAVAVGAFADPQFPGPAQEVYTETRHGWVAPLAGHDPA